MEHPVIDTGSLLTSGIKRHVKDKRISKTGKLNVSLASKIKTKILNNSSIFKISLKHNNRALAQALSREKENSRRITTERTLLQKEVEKLNFENTFLRLKLNNLNKKLIEIEALMNNNLITAIEMSTLSEFHQSPFPPSTSKKKRVSKQCTLTRLPFARVPLTSNDDDDDDDKEKMQHDDSILAKIPPDVPSLVSTRQPLSKSHVHSDQDSMSSPMSEMENAQSVSHRKEELSLSNVTERKKRLSSQESTNPSVDSSHGTDLDQQHISSPELNWNNEINDHTNAKNIKMQGNVQCLPDSSESTREPTAEDRPPFQGSDDFPLQKTVYDADMDLTASEGSKIITVSTGTRNKSNKKSNECGIKTFRKVKDSSSDKKRERSKRQFKNSSDINIEEKVENGPDKRSVVLNGAGDSEDPNFIFDTEQLTHLNILKKVTLHNGFDQEDRQSIQCIKRKKRIHGANEQEEEAYSFSQSSDKFLQENKFDVGQSSLPYPKSKASRQTFVIPKLEKVNLFSNQKNKETTSENLEVTSEFQTADLSTRDNESLCDYEAQNMSDLKKHVTDMQPAQQNESKINEKLRQKVSRKTEIIVEMNQVNEFKKKGVYDPEEGNFFSLTQTGKETISENLEVTSELQTAYLSTHNNGKLYDYETQNVLALKKPVTETQSAQQNESKINKKLKQKVNRKTEIISEKYHIHGGNDKDVHDQESYTKDLPCQVNISKQRLECQGVISGYSMEIDSTEKENCDQISNPYKRVKKHGKESSGKAKIFAKGENKSISRLPDSLYTSVFLESGLKYVPNEADSDPGRHMDLQENQKESSTTLNEKRDTPFVEVVKEGECQSRKVSKTACKSKKRKTIYPSSDSHKGMQVISDADQEISVESGQAVEKNSENERLVKMKPDFYKEAFKSLSQVYSPNIQESFFKSMHEDSVLSISPSRNLMIKENFALESSPSFQVSDGEHEKRKGMKFNQRTQKSEIGGRTLQDLTNTSFLSNNTAKAENKSENPSLELPSRRRRCIPLDLKEPNLKRKMRR
ncbi:shugoshin 2 isoform X2 [Meles meles]|uniref:shugoshin 2 isoform X2 n=1 Tax=Meles meles TaxID=9662 RepID=UPI001E69C560|nr:shugoshin 2 isoform X2 [Meles meles]